MSKKLKPCPFCGKKPSIAYGGPGDPVWYVECEGDEPEHTISLQSGGTREEAITAWNTRPVEDALIEALKEAKAWISWGNGLSAGKQGATCDTLDEVAVMIDDALKLVGDGHRKEKEEVCPK